MTRSWLVVLALASPAIAAPKEKPGAEQKEADRHFKAGVALFKEAKYTEAVAEFERAYEIAPHPLVLYNIASCYRELSRYGDAVKYYRRFLDEGKGKVPAARLAEAKTELDAVLARIARVTVTVTPSDGVTLALDGSELGPLPIEMPLVVAPGSHELVARSRDGRSGRASLRVASGDDAKVEVKLDPAPSGPTPRDPAPPATSNGVVGEHVSLIEPRARRKFAVGAAFGTNLLRVADTGAPSLAVDYAVHDRIELGLDAIVVAYAVMPHVRVRVVGDTLALHAMLAMPISFTDGAMSETFVAGAIGLGVRYRATPAFALRVESLVSFAGQDHGTTLPAFMGGELWF